MLWFYMKYVKELFRNAWLADSLDKKYYRITTSVGLVGVILGILIVIYVGGFLASFMGIDLDAPVQSLVSKLVGFVIGISFFILCLLVGMHISTSTFSMYMYFSGKFTKEEAVNYALYSRYPDHWFPNKP